MDLRKNIHANQHLQAAFNLDGEDAFVFEVLEVLPLEPKQLRLEAEQRLLDQFWDGGQACYNIAREATNPTMRGWNHSPEARQKMSAAKKGKASNRLGTHVSPETRAKLSAANKGKHLSPETKAKLSAAKEGEKHPFFGKTHSPEARQKISEAKKGEKHPNFGKHHSPETKAKISAALKARRKAREESIYL